MCSTRYLEARMQNPVSYTVTTHSDKCTHHISTSESLEYIPQKQSSKRECCIKTKFYTKKIVAFLLSHVGLASLVVLYTILGGYVFCWLEGSAENNTRIVVLQNRTQLVKELIRLNQYTQAKLLTLFEAHVAKQVSEEYYRVRLKAASGTGGNWPQNLSNISEWKVRSHADREKLTAGLAWYLAGLGWPRNIVPPSWFNNESPPPFEPIADQSYKPDTESTVASLTNATGQAPNLTSHNSTNPFPLDVLEFLPETILGVSTKSIILPLIFNITKEIEFKWEQLVESYTRNLVSAIKDKGWNGADEELGWNSEGSILYAVTIITTIGKFTKKAGAFIAYI
ncbi:hypothetical protein T265_01338 [Opisthorchis viverrini]|uniref:Potassium channel domain-containing protein n=1 Tax=Opisthorchis viverrini TaxID=6198 RepID=A0A075A362_OPIVI|nr:hypothetical protein T265_01338 [Opisthorchis viverrini]KER32652.1 hypothetical protein T265_01338 [Opisthorchis viverrini]